MASILKRKYMPRTALNEDFALPTAEQQFAQILGTKGNHLHEVRTVDGDTFLVSLPAKFRKRMWVKCRDYVLVEQIKEGNKVKGEVVNVLTKEHIEFLQQEGVWPEAFTEQEKVRITRADSEEDLWRNPNRPVESSEEDEDIENHTSEDQDSGPEDRRDLKH